MSKAEQTVMQLDAREKLRDVVLYFSYRPERYAARIARFYNSLIRHSINADFIILTYDETGVTRTETFPVDGHTIRTEIYGIDAVSRLEYPRKATQNSFKLKPGNCDVPVLLFWKDQPYYRRYWVIEDDVEFTGEFGDLLRSLGEIDGDLLATHLRPLPAGWDYADRFHAEAEGALSITPRLCFLPFFGASRAALAAIDGAYRRGWCGHHEMTWPAILDGAGLPIHDIGGAGPYVKPEDRNRYYIDHSPNDFRKFGSFGTMDIRLFSGCEREKLWHPVKALPDWIAMKRKRYLSILSWYVSGILGRIGGFTTKRP